jgi:phosphatidate cytidylyltransferase
VLIYRVLSAIILLPIVLAAAYLGGPPFALLVTVAALLSGFEFYRIARRANYRPAYLPGLALIVLAMFDAYQPDMGVLRWGVAAAVMAMLVWHVLQRDTAGFLVNWALTLTGAVYTGVLAGYLISVRNLPNGLGWLLLTLLGTWTCDTAAYFVGSYWGRRGFFTEISPKKTVEGAVGGCLVGLIVISVLGCDLGLTPWQALVLGGLLVLGVTLGDLSESLVKRQVGAKDSGDLIPGHGGMLDRIDSLLFAGPIVYYFLTWVVL